MKTVIGFLIAVVLAAGITGGVLGYRAYKVLQTLAPLATPVGSDTKTGQTVTATDVLAQLVIERLNAIKAQQAAAEKK